MSFNVKPIGMPLLSGVTPKADHPLGLGALTIWLKFEIVLINEPNLKSHQLFVKDNYN